MKSTTRSSTRMLGVAVAVSSLIVLAIATQSVQAGPIPPSDQLLISLPGPGAVLFDTLIPETIGPGTQPSAVFSPGAGLPALLPPGALAGLIPPGGVPGATFVILTEPAGEPIDPTELPPVVYPGPNGPVIVSDVLVNGLANQAGLPPFIALISDNNPDLAAVVGLIPPGAPVPVLLETGGLQDLTGLMGPGVLPGVGPIVVQVRSDVSVPEPSSIVILLGFAGMGLIGLTWHRHRSA